MKKQISFVVFLLVVFFPVLLAAQVKTYRIQDTTRDKSGWYFAKSTEGHFSVAIPMPFNDFTVSVEDAKGETVKSYSVGSKTNDGIKFVVTEAPYINGVTDPNLDSLVKGFSTKGNVIENVVNEQIAGFPAVTLFVIRKQDGAYIAWVKTTNSLITMIIEFPISFKTTIDQYTKTFFYSLKIL